MSDVIGRGVIEVSADSSQLVAGIDEAKRSIKSLGKAAKDSGTEAGKGIGGIGDPAEPAARKVDRATKSIIASIQRATASAEAGERGARGYFEVLARQRGVSVDTLKPYLDQLEAVSVKQVRTGISAAQMSAALRGVPAQFTDIATSLQAGQNPMTVFLQQGGQLKDMFGGAAPAARALGGYVLSLINPLTLAAAAAGVLAVAYHQGSQESDAYNRALVLTGNAAGTTRDQLAAMARNIDQVRGTQASAAAALAELAGSGQVGAESLERFARVALQIESTVGQAVSDTVKDLAELGKAPVEASEKLNEKYRYLTASTYAYIKAAEEQGRTEDAATAAQNAYINAFDERTKKLEANLGTIEKAWKGVKNAAADAWDSLLAVGREQSIDKRIEQLEQMAAPGRGIFAGRSKEEDAELARLKERKKFEDEKAKAEAESLKRQAAGIAWQKEGDKYLTKAQQTEREIFKARELGNLAGESEVEIEKRIAAIRAKAAGENAPKELAHARLGFDLEKIKEGSQALVEAYANADKIIQANRAANLINEREYFAAKEGVLRLTSDAEERALEQEIARLQKEKLKGKEKVENDRKIAETQAKLNKVRADTAANLEVLATQEAAANRRIADSYIEATIAAQNYIDTIRRQGARQIAGIGKGEEVRARQSDLGQLEDRRNEKQQQLEGQLRTGEIDRGTFDAYLELVNDTYTQEVAAYNDRTDAIKAAQSDWMNGAREAFANYQTNAQNVAGSSAAMFSQAFEGMTSGVATSISRAIVYGEDFGAAMKNVALGIADAFISAWIKMQIQKLFIDKTAATAYAGTVAAQSQAMVAMAGLAAFASTAAIPVVGPALAPEAAAAAMAAAEIFATAATAAASLSVASARGGYDIPAGVNPLTQLHEREMVLPAPQADVIRGLAKNGGESGANGSGAITIVNNTSARIGKVTEQRLSNGERALIIEEAVAAVAAQHGDPNSRISRAMGKNYSVQRSR